MIAGQVDPMAAVIPVNNSDKNINNNNSDIRAVTYKAENYYVAVKGSRAEVVSATEDKRGHRLMTFLPADQTHILSTEYVRCACMKPIGPN